MTKCSRIVSVFVLLVAFAVSPSAEFQTQDVEALATVTRALENLVRDTDVIRKQHGYRKTHRIDNLNADESVRGLEKQAIFRSARNNNGNVTEHLVSIEPANVKPADNPVDTGKFLEGFLNRQYFRYLDQVRNINGNRCTGIAFEPKPSHLQPRESDNADKVISRARGVIWVSTSNEKVCQVTGGLARTIDYFVFSMEKFNFQVDFQSWNGLTLVSTMRATTKYQYLGFVRRHQTHTIGYEYLP